jgi:hypothetical protein
VRPARPFRLPSPPGRAGRHRSYGIALVLALALAAPVTSAQANIGLSKLQLKAQSWEVSINGRVHHVKANGVVTYCPTATIDRVTPVAVLTAEGAGRHTYISRLSGPASAGQTPVTERAFNGRRTVLRFGVTALDFLKLAVPTNTPRLPAGVYGLKLSVAGRRTPSVTERVTLEARKARC